jgi:hypothetical protein
MNGAHVSQIVQHEHLIESATPYALRAPVAEACASFSFWAHSSQQTSIALPPIVTLIAFSSSL